MTLSTACPKPASTPKTPRTRIKPVSDKKAAQPIAHCPAPRTPVKRRNEKAIAKKSAKYAKYIRSAAWKAKRLAAIERAGGQCEQTHAAGFLIGDMNHRRKGGGLQPLMTLRCHMTEQLTVHHLTYARFGGDEFPEDLQVLCRTCHDRAEALKGKRPKFHRASQERT